MCSQPPPTTTINPLTSTINLLLTSTTTSPQSSSGGGGPDLITTLVTQAPTRVSASVCVCVALVGMYMWGISIQSTERVCVCV